MYDTRYNDALSGALVCEWIFVMNDAVVLIWQKKLVEKVKRRKKNGKKQDHI